LRGPEAKLADKPRRLSFYVAAVHRACCLYALFSTRSRNAVIRIDDMNYVITTIDTAAWPTLELTVELQVQNDTL